MHFDAAQDNAAPWIVFLGGVLPSSLLAAALARLLRQQDLLRSRAEALAANLSTDLERLAQVAQVAQVVQHTRMPCRRPTANSASIGPTRVSRG